MKKKTKKKVTTKRKVSKKEEMARKEKERDRIECNLMAFIFAMLLLLTTFNVMALICSKPKPTNNVTTVEKTIEKGGGE